MQMTVEQRAALSFTLSADTPCLPSLTGEAGDPDNHNNDNNTVKGIVGRPGKCMRRPLETALAAPEARVAPVVYTPASLRPGASGWYPEYGKAWENWGVPLYVP